MPKYTVELYCSTNMTYTVNANNEEEAEEIATSYAYSDGYQYSEVENIISATPYKYYNQDLNTVDSEASHVETSHQTGTNSYQPYVLGRGDSEELDTNVISISPPGDGTVH